jgi:DNA repair exonuclease SbcCD ATPase subunit
MKIKKVEATNFLSYKKLDYAYSDQGLTLIEGHDQDLGVSTGAGKSAFLDVISFALSGKISKDLASDEIINRQAKKDLMVKLEFEDDNGRACAIHRCRRHSEFGNDVLLVVDGHEIRGKDVRETQKLIEDHIGFNFEVFSKATYFSQFSPVDRFLSASDGDKKNLISEICDLSYYDELLLRVKEDVNIRKADVENGQILLNVEMYKKAHIKSKIDQSKFLIEEWQQKKDKKILTMEESCRNFNLQKHGKLVALDQQLSNAVSNFDASHAKLASLKVAPVDYSAEKTAIQQKLEMVRKLEQKRMEINVQLNQTAIDADRLANTIESEKAKMAAGKDSTCYHCYQNISADKIQVKVASLAAEKEKKEVAITQLRQALAQIDGGLQVKSQLSNRLVEIGLAERAVEQARGEMATINYTIPILDARIKEILKDIEAAKVMENPWTKALADAKAEENPYRMMDEAEYDSLCKKVDELTASNATKTEELNYSIWWKDALSVYIRSYLMDSFLEQINVKANEYLETLFDGILQINISATTEKDSKVKEKISVTITNGNEECSYESLSGGERCRICLAVNLAISDLTCKMSRTSFNVLMLDEILNGLDDHGKNQTMKLLKELETKYDTIFVIDHTEGFKTMFTNTVTVVKKDSVSAVV